MRYYFASADLNTAPASLAAAIDAENLKEAKLKLHAAIESVTEPGAPWGDFPVHASEGVKAFARLHPDAVDNDENWTTV